MKHEIIFLQVAILGKLVTAALCVGRQVSALWKKQQNEWLLDARRVKVVQERVNMRSISLPFSLEKKETGRLHGPTRAGNVLEVAFEQDFKFAQTGTVKQEGPKKHPIDSGPMVHYDQGALHVVEAITRSVELRKCKIR